jgi:Domain of unknown function (DUF1932)
MKLAYASYQKASRVLSAVAHALADAHGVGDALAHEAQRLHSRPLADVDALPSVAARAWRWAPELREAAQTLRDAGLPDGLAQGAAQALERWEAVKDRDDIGLDALLDLLSDRRGPSSTTPP